MRDSDRVFCRAMTATIRTVLVANRGEVAVRILRTTRELGIRSVGVYAPEDALSLHVRRADHAMRLAGNGASAYLDVAAIVASALSADCDAIHPGYGFLSESPRLAQACLDAGLVFVGPTVETLTLLGDKVAARSLAQRCGVPVTLGTPSSTSLEEARAFVTSLHGARAMIKAVNGGGGRGMRIVHSASDVEQAYGLCQQEARAAFGDDALYVEQLIDRARHIEIQVVGDGSGDVTHLWERECTLQRRRQKLVEVAPSPSLSASLRDQLVTAALRMAKDLRYRGVATFEFLIADGSFVFMEANPRLQVEHTVTEEVTGVDLVKAQLQIAGGASLREIGLTQSNVQAPRGFAVQARVNMETMQRDGGASPSAGTLTTFELPSGPGVRVDSFGYAGYATSPSFDSLLAKVIAHVPTGSYVEALDRCDRALSELQIEGVATNSTFLQALLHDQRVRDNDVHTRFVEEHAAEWIAEEISQPVQSQDEITAPLLGTIVSVEVSDGELVARGQALFVIEAMKMQHVVEAAQTGVVKQLMVKKGATVHAGQPLGLIVPTMEEELARDHGVAIDLDAVRPDLAEAIERHAIGLDARRVDAVAKRHQSGHRTARENIADLLDPGSFVEYGALAIAAQRGRRSEEELIERTPADGLVMGIGSVNGAVFEESRAQCVVMSYDYMVMAGTQGVQNHIKKDRMIEIAERSRLPVVFFTEGGGGRPGDTDALSVTGLDCLAFSYFGQLSGLVPLVGIASGRCFAGNALLLGCCDVIIATRDANIGMGGPAMIEGGGLGVFRPEEVGPTDVQVSNGVIDVLVTDEAEAVRVAKQYLAYFQGPTKAWNCEDQRQLRTLVPENRLRVYDSRRVIDALADQGSVLELRPQFAPAMITALVRVEGRPVGVIANNPIHQSGAIESPDADKASRFMQLCDAHDLPILFLCDTPGFMVGPEAEKTALVRHLSRMVVTAGSLTVPFFTIVLRKGYGLGSMAMAGGSFRAPHFIVAWPTGEFGGMGFEGAVRLAFKNQLNAIDDEAQRKQVFDSLVAEAYRRGKGLNVATHFDIDDVIDPADSRKWITSALKSAPPPRDRRSAKKRPFIDTW